MTTQSLTPLDADQTHGAGPLDNGRKLDIPGGHPDAAALAILWRNWCTADSNARNTRANDETMRASNATHRDRIGTTIEFLLTRVAPVGRKA